MKLATTSVFIAATLFAGSALAFDEDMTEYPRNVVVEQQSSLDRAEVQAELAASTPSVFRGALVDYPVNSSQPATALTRDQVKQDLARFVGNGVRERVNTVDHFVRG